MVVGTERSINTCTSSRIRKRGCPARETGQEGGLKRDPLRGQADRHRLLEALPENNENSSEEIRE